MSERHDEQGLSICETIASLLLYVFGFLSVIRGVYWLTRADEAYEGGGVYSALNDIAPLGIWGIIIVSAGLCVVISGYLIPKRRRTTSFFWLLVIGGLFSSLVYFTASVAGFHNAVNWMSPAQVVLLSAGHGFLAFVGGAELWKIKNN